MKPVSGPVLYFRGCAAGAWRLAALLVMQGQSPPPPLWAAGVGVPARRLDGRLGSSVWVYEFAVPMDPGGVDYAIGADRWTIHPPAADRLRVAYTACNGQEDRPLGDGDFRRNGRWRDLAARHAAQPFQLLVQGGDQLYADGVWESAPELSRWRRLGRRARVAAAFSEAAAEAAADFYYDHYCRLWAQPELAPLLASIPSLMMWDDHDVFDGWGSHGPDLQCCPVFLGVWRAARTYFALFQLAARPGDLPAGCGDPQGAHFGWCHDLGDWGLIAPDLRSERTRNRVLGELGWNWFEAALESLAGCRRVLMVSTVPLINLDLSPLERLSLLLPGQRFYQDDFRDQWRSFRHRAEWRRMLGHLLDFSERSGAAVTVLSGEIHLGALGLAERGATRIHQLTASGIVHPPPPGGVVRVYEWLSRGSALVEPGCRVRMLPLPGFGRRYLNARNWLSLDCRADGGAEAVWRAEEIGDLPLDLGRRAGSR